MKTLAATAMYMALGIATAAHAAPLQSQYGILDLTANGGINPNTGVAWQPGDQYRLAFYTAGKIVGTSNDPNVYDSFATAQANLSGLGNGAITTSTGWTAMVWVNTDGSLNQAADLNNPVAGESPISDPKVRAGMGTSGGVSIYAMDGTTAIARDDSDINAWNSPFANVDSGWGPNGQPADSSARLPVGYAGMTSTNTQTVYYSPFLDQYAAGDSGSQHGVDVMTGGFWNNPVNPAGDTINDATFSRGSSNANNPGRVWNRFTDATTTERSVYAISPLLTVTEIPEPASLALLGLGGLLIARRRS
jgi:hypothetical protein